MRILVQKGYNMQFNAPRDGSVEVIRAGFFPLGRVWLPLEAIALTLPGKNYDVLHSFNGIPLYCRSPWLITFESHLPRTLGSLKGRLSAALTRRLTDPKCLALIAMSEWASALFRNRHGHLADWPVLASKLRVLPPSIAPRSTVPKELHPDETLRLCFVGNDFARKGGVVAVRFAKIALKEKLPVEIHICSALRFGKGCHTDHPDNAKYSDDMAGLNLPNVVCHGAVDNSRVLEILQNCHLSFLATLHDTYGYSTIEGFACGLPAITTNVCALPEINPLSVGFQLKLPANSDGMWEGLNTPNISTDSYWERVSATYDSLALQTAEIVKAILANPEWIGARSAAALARIEAKHNPVNAASTLNALYKGKPLESAAPAAMSRDRN